MYLKVFSPDTECRCILWIGEPSVSQIVSLTPKAFFTVDRMSLNCSGEFPLAAARSICRFRWDHQVSLLSRIEFTSRVKPYFIILAVSWSELASIEKAQGFSRNPECHYPTGQATTHKTSRMQGILHGRPVLLDVLRLGSAARVTLICVFLTERNTISVRQLAPGEVNDSIPQMINNWTQHMIPLEYIETNDRLSPILKSRINSNSDVTDITPHNNIQYISQSCETLLEPQQKTCPYKPRCKEVWVLIRHIFRRLHHAFR